MEKPIFRLAKAKILPDPDDKRTYSADNFYYSEQLNLSLRNIIEKQIAGINAADMQQNDDYTD